MINKHYLLHNLYYKEIAITFHVTSLTTQELS